MAAHHWVRVLLRGFCLLKGTFFFHTTVAKFLLMVGGKWSRPAPREKCQEMTSVVNWRYSKKYRIKVGRSVGRSVSRSVGYCGLQRTDREKLLCSLVERQQDLLRSSEVWTNRVKPPPSVLFLFNPNSHTASCTTPQPDTFMWERFY